MSIFWHQRRATALARMLREICFRRELFVVHCPADAVYRAVRKSRYNPNGLSRNSDRPRCCGGREEKTQLVEQGMTYSILVVEDEDDVRDLVSASLRHRGFSVLSVPNAEVALQILGENVKFDLLFTDIVMPGLIDGFELADRAKRLQPNLKVLYATGFAHVSRRPAEKLHGKLIHKPYRADDLASEVRQTLEGTA